MFRKISLKTVDFADVQAFLLDEIFSSDDVALAFCVREKGAIFDENFTFLRINFLPDPKNRNFPQTLCIFAKKNFSLDFLLPIFLLPIALKFRDKCIFVLGDCICAYISTRLIYLEKYEDFGDILACEEALQTRFSLKADQIFCDEIFPSLGKRAARLVDVDVNFAQNLAKKLFATHKNFFIPPIKNTGLFLAAAYFLTLIFSLVATVFFMQNYVKSAENSGFARSDPKPHKKSAPKNFSHYSLLFEIFMAAQNSDVKIKKISFDSAALAFSGEFCGKNLQFFDEKLREIFAVAAKKNPKILKNFSIQEPKFSKNCAAYSPPDAALDEDARDE